MGSELERLVEAAWQGSGHDVREPMSSVERRMFTGSVRAVLEAMKTPSEEMQQVGYEAVAPNFMTSEEPNCSQAARDAWTAMLDSILGDEER